MSSALWYTSNPFERNDHTVNESDDRNNRFEIHTIESMQAQQYVCNSEAEKISNFEVIWLKNGTGTLQIDGKDYRLMDNSIYCLFPASIRRINIDTEAEGHYFSFALEFLKLSEGYSNSAAWLEEFDCYTNIASAFVGKEMQAEFEMIIKKMTLEYSNFFNRRLELLKGLLNIFMIYLSRSLNAVPQPVIRNREKDLVNKFIFMMKRNFRSKKLVNDYAALLFVTSNYLNRIVKKITGFTASHHIQQQIILEAKRQAMYSSTSMKQIAYSLGFDNLAHFSKFFKNNCGMSFTEYKKVTAMPD